VEGKGSGTLVPLHYQLIPDTGAFLAERGLLADLKAALE
jgi:hypothetical protein